MSMPSKLSPIISSDCRNKQNDVFKKKLRKNEAWGEKTYNKRTQPVFVEFQTGISCMQNKHSNHCAIDISL